MKRLVILPAVMALILCTLPLSAHKEGEHAKVVDSGSFGIFRSGQRVATETFRITQDGAGSLTESEIKTQGADAEMSQKSELALAANGDLMKYTWQQLKPEKQQLVLEPGDQVLHQRYGTDEKQAKDLPYLLPASTSVLDDYFFIQREVLTWKYMASECATLANCKLTPARIGVVIPHDHNPEIVTIEFKGRQKITVKGKEEELNQFLMHTQDSDWTLYFDDAQKLVMAAIPAAQTEAIRDEMN